MKYNIAVTRAKQSRISEVDFSHLAFGHQFCDHMFVADYADGQWGNFRIQPLQDFVLHPATMALHYGQALFEGMKAAKTRDGQPVLFRPEMHAQRLNASARRLCMPELPEDLFIEAVQRLVALDANWIPQQEESALYIRPGMFATDAFVGVRPSKSYCFYIINSPVGPYYSHPVRLCAETHYVRAIRGGVGEAKVAGNYAAALLPTQIAQEKGFDQVMWLDGLNFEYIQEVGTMNIFFVIDGKVVTPETDGAILKGITRDSIIHLLQDNGYEVEVRPLSIHEVVEAYQAGKLQECFGSGTAAVVSHVSEIAYGDLLMHLPPIESRKVGDFAKAEINGIRSGLLPDPYGWVVPVETPVPAG
jgi:branched-chain amino acid aminotransferase